MRDGDGALDSRSSDLGLDLDGDDQTTGKTSSSLRSDWRSCTRRSSLRTHTVTREPGKLEENRKAAQEFIDNGGSFSTSSHHILVFRWYCSSGIAAGTIREQKRGQDDETHVTS